MANSSETESPKLGFEGCASLLVALSSMLYIANLAIGRPASAQTEEEFRDKALAAASVSVGANTSLQEKFATQFIDPHYIELPWKTGGNGLLGSQTRRNRTIQVGQTCLRPINPFPAYATSYQAGKVVWGPKGPIVGVPGSYTTSKIPSKSNLEPTSPESFRIVRDDEPRTALRFAVSAAGVVTPDKATRNIISQPPYNCDVAGVPVGLIETHINSPHEIIQLGHVSAS